MTGFFLIGLKELLDCMTDERRCRTEVQMEGDNGLKIGWKKVLT